MKRLLYIMCFATLALTSCKESKQHAQQTLTPDAVTNDMVSIDEISECEAIIEDSTLMDGKGDRAWTKKGGMIRIKNGDKSYLRMQTKDGSVTAVTYKYIDE
jgi:major membrane immunogen (membrane-anchored lipoprotein)